MGQIALHVLPCNRARVHKYISNPRLAVVDYLIRPLLQRDPETNSEILQRFMDYVTSEEDRLHENLDRFQWKVDASNTLSLITGPGRLERVSTSNSTCAHADQPTQHILPVLSLLLQRHADIIRLACKYPLNDLELYEAAKSVGTLAESACKRLFTLKGPH